MRRSCSLTVVMRSSFLLRMLAEAALARGSAERRVHLGPSGRRPSTMRWDATLTPQQLHCAASNVRASLRVYSALSEG